jgi:hypothetical protein
VTTVDNPNSIARYLVRLKTLFPSLAAGEHEEAVLLQRHEVGHPSTDEEEVALQHEQRVVQRLLLIIVARQKARRQTTPCAQVTHARVRACFSECKYCWYNNPAYLVDNGGLGPAQTLGRPRRLARRLVFQHNGRIVAIVRQRVLGALPFAQQGLQQRRRRLPRQTNRRHVAFCRLAHGYS